MWRCSSRASAFTIVLSARTLIRCLVLFARVQSHLRLRAPLLCAMSCVRVSSSSCFSFLRFRKLMDELLSKKRSPSVLGRSVSARR